MQAFTTTAGKIGAGNTWAPQPDGSTIDRLAAAAGAIGLLVSVLVATLQGEDIEASISAMTNAGSGSGIGRTGYSGTGLSGTGSDTAIARETTLGGYLGVTHTHPSVVTIRKAGTIPGSGTTDMTVSGFGWDGKPFKSPIYYGARVIRWADGGRVGALLDFTHAKAVSRFDDTATFTGQRDGKPLPDKARLGDAFKHLEFSHGHNMLTLNGILRLGYFPVQPYVGAGAGISLPHTEIGYRDEPGRTYEYQYAGLTGQVLAGLEFRIGRTSVFLEYKLSYSPYDVPLSGVVNGHYLLTDLWRQFRAWTSGERPPGGRLSTPLVTHHGIGGVMIRVGASPVR